MKKVFVRQARLPKGAYAKDLKEVLGSYKNMENNNTKMKCLCGSTILECPIHTKEGHVPYMYYIMVVCNTCKQKVEMDADSAEELATALEKIKRSLLAHEITHTMHAKKN